MTTPHRSDQSPRRTDAWRDRKDRMDPQDLMRVFEDIEHRDRETEHNSSFDGLRTNLRWDDGNENELNSRNKLIKKWMTGSSSNEFRSLSIASICQQINSKMKVSDLRVLLDITSSRCLETTAESVRLNQTVEGIDIDPDAFLRLFLCTESRAVYEKLFWFFFATYFVEKESVRNELSDRIQCELSTDFMYFVNSPLIHKLSKNAKSKSLKRKRKKFNLERRSTAIEVMKQKLPSDCFFDSYPFMVAEALYLCFVRHFGAAVDDDGKWIIDYRVRDRIASDTFYLLNGVEISSITLNHHLFALFPEGTAIPPPILSQKINVKQRLRRHTIASPPRSTNGIPMSKWKRRESGIGQRESQLGSRLGSQLQNERAESVKNGVRRRVRNSPLSISTCLIPQYPLRIWLAQRMITRKPLHNAPRKQLFSSRRMSPLFRQKSSMERGHQFAMHRVEKSQNPISIGNLHRSKDISTQCIAIRKKIYHSLSSNSKMSHYAALKQIASESQSRSIVNAKSTTALSPSSGTRPSKMRKSSKGMRGSNMGSRSSVVASVNVDKVFSSQLVDMTRQRLTLHQIDSADTKLLE